MKIEEETPPSFTYFLCATIALFALSIFAIVGFLISCHHLMDHFINDTPVIVFNRGGAFGLGGFIGLFPTSVGILLIGVLRKPLTQTIQNIVAYSWGIGITIMLSLPIISSIAVSVYAYNKDYIDCDEAEYKPTWPIYRINYYTKDQATCTELVAELEIERPFL